MKRFGFIALIALFLSVSCIGSQSFHVSRPPTDVEPDSTPDLTPSRPDSGLPAECVMAAQTTDMGDEAFPTAAHVEAAGSAPDPTPTDPGLGLPAGSPALDPGTDVADKAPPPAAYIEKVDSTPDLTQTDPALGLLEGGVMSCGSVSATNAFAWLANHGFEEIVHRYGDGNVSYAKTAQAMDRLLQLKEKRGALPPAFLMGVERYLSEQGYADSDYRLGFQGWLRPRNPEGAEIPDLDAIKKGIVGSSAVWLFVGFYHFDEPKDEYHIISFHYVTLVGYGVNEHGDEDPNVLIVHDPAPRSGPGVSHNYVQIERIDNGSITVDTDSLFAPNYRQLPIDATDYYKLGTGLAYNPNADVAILDGVVILEMK